MATNNYTTIYALIDPRTNETRYIGKTSNNPISRYNHHLYRAKKGYRSYVYCWIRGLLLNGLKPIQIILEIVEGDGCDIEQKWIAHGREQGWKLTNLTDGGEGHLGYKPTQATRILMSEKQKQRITPDECARRSVAIKKQWEVPEIRERRLEGLHRAATDGTLSKANRKGQHGRWDKPGARERQSQTLKRVKSTPEARAKMSIIAKSISSEVRRNAGLKRYESSEERTKTSVSSKKLWQDPEYRDKQSVSRKRAWQNDDLRKQKSESTKSSWQDPETRAKRLEGLKRNAANPEYLEKLRRFWKAKWADPEYRKKMAEARKKKQKC